MEAQDPTSSVGFEMNNMVNWFEKWNSHQRRVFLESLLPKIVPEKLFAHTSRLNLEQDQACPVSPELCVSFNQQLLYCHNCLDKWTADDSNQFINILEDVDRTALYLFYDMIAATAGEL